MAQVEDKLKWCLNKSNKGLVKVEINPEKANNHIKKAEHNLKATIFFSKNGFSDWAVNASFYSMYHCLLAILAKHGYESLNQECTIALVYNLIDKKEIDMETKWLNLISKHGSDELENDSVIKLRGTSSMELILM